MKSEVDRQVAAASEEQSQSESESVKSNKENRSLNSMPIKKATKALAKPFKKSSTTLKFQAPTQQKVADSFTTQSSLDQTPT